VPDDNPKTNTNVESFIVLKMVMHPPGLSVYHFQRLNCKNRILAFSDTTNLVRHTDLAHLYRPHRFLGPMGQKVYAAAEASRRSQSFIASR